MNQATDELGADVAAALSHLIAVRFAWRPEDFDLIYLVAGTRGGSEDVSFDALVATDDLYISKTFAWMARSVVGEFTDLVSQITPDWRLALLQAYAGKRHSGLPQDQALVPTKPLSIDPTGHFVPMRFHT